MKSRPALPCPLTALFFALAVFLTALPSSAENWPAWRGPLGTGLCAEKNLPVKWSKTENVRWRIALPEPGNSTPIVWGHRVFVTQAVGERRTLMCFNRADGRLLWQSGVTTKEKEPTHQTNPYCSASPVTDGERVIASFASDGLFCYDLDGKELWRHPLPLALSGGRFGTGTSPIIVGDRVILNRDQYQYSSLLALDLATGRKVWDTPRPESSGSFGTPAIWPNNGVDEVVLAGSAQLKGYELQTGVERWTIPNVTGTVSTTPVVGEGMLFFAAWSQGQADSPRPQWEKFLAENDKDGDGAVSIDELPPARRDFIRSWDRDRDGKITTADWEKIKAGDARAENVLIAVRPGGTGDISETHVAWKYRKALPYVPTPLVYDGRIYFVKDGGLMSSLDAKTGEPFYAQERLGPTGNYYASPVLADGRIYLASLPGKLVVVKAGGTKPEVLHTADFGERILATPALVENKIYLRTQTKLYAFGE